MQNKIFDLKGFFLHTILDESKLVVLYAKFCSAGFPHYYLNINIIVCYPWIEHRETFFGHCLLLYLWRSEEVGLAMRRN